MLKAKKILGLESNDETENEAFTHLEAVGESLSLQHLCLFPVGQMQARHGQIDRVWWCILFLRHLREKHTLPLHTPDISKRHWTLIAITRSLSLGARTLAGDKSSLFGVHRQRTSGLQQLLKIMMTTYKILMNWGVNSCFSILFFFWLSRKYRAFVLSYFWRNCVVRPKTGIDWR